MVLMDPDKDKLYESNRIRIRRLWQNGKKLYFIVVAGAIPLLPGGTGHSPDSPAGSAPRIISSAFIMYKYLNILWN